MQVRVELVNSHVEIIVSDTGEGIDAGVLPYIFDRFRQGEGSLTRSNPGLGLGLSIVRHLVEGHGGQVHAFSEGPGQGATFTVTLPLSGAEDRRRLTRRIAGRRLVLPQGRAPSCRGGAARVAGEAGRGRASGAIHGVSPASRSRAASTTLASRRISAVSALRPVGVIR